MRIGRQERCLFTKQKVKPKNLYWWYFLVLTLTFLFGSAYWYFIVADAPPIWGPQKSDKNNKLRYRLETYDSQVMGEQRTYGISLPPDYDKNQGQHYPVIFLLHGGHGKPTDWFEKAAALSIVHKLYKEGKLPFSIIITPDGTDRRGSSPFFDPDYIDGPNGNIDTAIGEELVKVIQSRYRTLPTPAFWAIGGLSSGGWGALNIGLHHPNHFSIMFSHSGYFKDKSGFYNSPQDYITKLTPETRAKLRVYLDAGQGDGKYLDESREFQKVLNQKKVNSVFHEFPGGHVTVLLGPDATWNYWNKHLADSLSYVGKQFHEASVPKSDSASYKKHHHKSRK